MKRLTLLLLMKVSTNVMAEWMLIGENNAGEFMIYVDTAALIKKEDKVKIWYLNDFKRTQVYERDRYLSEKVQKEYDCGERQFRMLAVLWLLGNMGNGRSVWWGYKIHQWMPVSPASIDEALFKVACGIK